MQLIRLNLERFLLCHVLNVDNSSGKDLFSGRAASSLLCWQRRQITQKVLRINSGYRFIDYRSEHFSPHRKYFFSKCNSHSSRCFVAIQSLLLTKRIHCFFNSHFLEENDILKFVSFHYWHNQKYTSELHIYYLNIP